MDTKQLTFDYSDGNKQAEGTTDDEKQVGE